MKKFALTVCLFLIPLAAEATVSVSAGIEPTQPTLEDEVQLTVTVSGSRNASEPALPSMPAFKIVSNGTSTSISIINGQTDFRKEYTYVMIPVAEGNFTINPISIFADGIEYKTNPIQVTVGKGGRAPAVTPPGIPSGPFEPAPVPEDENQAGKPYWITAEVSNLSPYVNEGILYTFRFYTSVNVGDANLTLPDFKDFRSEELVPEKKYYQNRGGDRFVVSEKVIMLYPLQAGNIDIGTTSLEVAVPDSDRDNFFDPFGFGKLRMRTKNLTAAVIPLKVKALPPAPDDFSNLVGQFSLSSSLTSAEIKAGESTTLKVEILGKGNIKDAILPPMAGIDGFKVYDDKPSVDVTRKETGIEGKKTFKRALVPTRPMEVTLPAPSATYFDPQEGIYKKMEGTPAMLKVLPSPDANTTVTAGGAPSFSGEGESDIAPIHLGSSTRPSESAGILFLLFGFVPPVLFFSVWLFRRRKEAMSLNAGQNRTRRALKVFQSQLKQIKKLEAEQALLALMAAVKAYAGDRMGVYGQAFTVLELCLKMKEAGVTEVQLERLKKTLDALEGACYGQKGGVSKPVSEWIREVEILVKEVDRGVRKNA